MNNHPLESENWVMIHNGSCLRMDRLKGYPYKGEVDSEVLLSYIEKYNLKKGLPYLGYGTASIALINKHHTDNIILWREANPLWLAYDEASKTIFFASEEGFLRFGLRNKMFLFTTYQVSEMPKNWLIRLETNPIDIKYIDTIEADSSLVCKDAVTAVTTTYGSTSAVSNWGGTTKYTPISKNLLEFNDKDKRWEKKGTEEDTKDDKDKEFNALLELGYSEDQIKKMGEKQKQTVIRYTISCGTSVTTAAVEKEIPKDKPNKYYFKGGSQDFAQWIKLSKPSKIHISSDGEYIKKWSTDKKCHFIMDLEEAVKENEMSQIEYEEFLELSSEEDQETAEDLVLLDNKPAQKDPYIEAETADTDDDYTGSLLTRGYIS